MTISHRKEPTHLEVRCYDYAKGDTIGIAWVYILECSDGSYYTGSTTNLAVRIAEHQMGLGGRYTSGRLPVRLVFASEFSDEDEALRREFQIKGWSRKKKEALIRGDYNRLIHLARKKKSC